VGQTEETRRVSLLEFAWFSSRDEKSEGERFSEGRSPRGTCDLD
jgi:hypothetical protein